MRVDDRNLAGSSAPGAGKAADAQRVERAGDAGAGQSHAGAASDRIELSALSRALSAHETSRSQRVANLAQAYQTGRYSPDPTRVSRALINEGIATSANRLP